MYWFSSSKRQNLEEVTSLNQLINHIYNFSNFCRFDANCEYSNSQGTSDGTGFRCALSKCRTRVKILWWFDTCSLAFGIIMIGTDDRGM